ncbi:MAG: hypothetical protein BWY77_01554 [bacterium ADurb.Bin431]|nr:MAG: hypothetical protein BWY77_01554 [bacterium ADurb.Bin431]
MVGQGKAPDLGWAGQIALLTCRLLPCCRQSEKRSARGGGQGDVPGPGQRPPARERGQGGCGQEQDELDGPENTVLERYPTGPPHAKQDLVLHREDGI